MSDRNLLDVLIEALRAITTATKRAENQSDYTLAGPSKEG